MSEYEQAVFISYGWAVNEKRLSIKWTGSAEARAQIIHEFMETFEQHN